MQNNDSISKSKTSSPIPYTLVNSNYCLSQNVYLLNIYDALEDIAPPKGEYLAQYQSKNQLLISSGKNFEQNYQAYFVNKRLLLKDFCIKFNCKYRQIRTDLPIYKQLRPL